MQPWRQLIAKRLVQSRVALEALESAAVELPRLVGCVTDCLARGGTLLTCGNGGSAAEALHMAEELVGRYRSNRPPLRALCLNADPTALTCIANDFGFEEVFARPVRALGRRGDALLVFSTSGRSPNLLRALEEARGLGLTCLGMLGGEGGPALELCHAALVVHGCDGAAVQEAHQIAMHIICEALEEAVLPTGAQEERS